MKNLKKGITLLVLVSLMLGIIGCTASSDPIVDATKKFSIINRIERQNPGAMNFSKEQAEELLTVIEPVLSGVPLTEDLAETLLKDLEALLTKEQTNLMNQNSTPTPSEERGQGAGMGGGTGVPGSGTGVPGSGETAGTSNGFNMFLRLDDTIRNNYLSN